MATYKINPTYFRVEWSQTSPTDYSGLTGTQAGGLDSTPPAKYNSRINITGNTANPTMSAGDTLIINGEMIEFGNSNLAQIITEINMHSITTKVVAHNEISSNYITLTNASGYESEAIAVAEGNGGLANLGIAASVYKDFPCILGSAFGVVASGNKIIINGALITLSGNTIDTVINDINAKTPQTSVRATKGAGKIQLNSVCGQPIVTANSAPTTIDPTAIGFPAGIYAGEPSTYAESANKALANLRWQMVVMQLEQSATPFVVNYQTGFGNFDGSSELDAFAFTVGFERPDTVVTVELPGEPNPGNVLTGAAAIKRAVARALVATYTSNVNLFDPTTELRNNVAIRPNPVRIVTLTADGFDTLANLATVEGNITVSMIAFE